MELLTRVESNDRSLARRGADVPLCSIVCPRSSMTVLACNYSVEDSEHDVSFENSPVDVLRRRRTEKRISACPEYRTRPILQQNSEVQNSRELSSPNDSQERIPRAVRRGC